MDSNTSSFKDKTLGKMRCAEQYGNFGGNLGDFYSRLEPIHYRHLKIEYHKVRVQFSHSINGLSAINGLRANLPILVLFHEASEGAPHLRVVVDDEYSSHSFAPPAAWHSKGRESISHLLEEKVI